jgi:amino acid transporter
VVEEVSSPTTTTATPTGLFARNATGLVRQVSPFSAYVLNFIGGHPVQPLAFGLFFAFATWPGGNFFLGGLLAIPMVLAFSYSFGLLTSMMPRTGGDYTLNSRILHPTLGLIGSFCQTMANFMSAAFFGRLIVTLGLGPGLIGIGLVAHNQGLIDAGNTLANSKVWIFIFGTLLFLAAAGVLGGGWGWTLRLQNGLFFVVTGGLALCAIIALLTPQSQFIANFNNFAEYWTKNPDTYHQIINGAKQNGVPLGAEFSWGNTIPMIGIFATFSIFSWFTSFIGGEIRQARSVKTANIMALSGITSLLAILLCAAIFLNTFGTDFFTAANATNGMPGALNTAPTYFFLLSASLGSVPMSILLVGLYLLFWPMLTYFVFLQPTRTMFAYAFDGILPKGITNISRNHAPYVAVGVTFVLTELVFIWSLTNDSIFQVIIYATLIQLVSMGLVGLSALVVPWRRPQLYQAAATKIRVLGVPLVSIAGAVAIFSAAFIWWLFFNYAGFGLADPTGLFIWLGGLIVAALALYFVARWVRARQGVDLRLTYAEIPPE